MRCLLIALLALLTAATPAQAGWKIDRATAIARVVWHHPCEDHVTLKWGGADMDGGDALAEADPAQCTIWLVDYSRYAMDWPVFCTTVIHEYGHLAGYRDPLNTGDPYHSHNADSVMSAFGVVNKHVVHVAGGKTTTIWTGVDPRCARNGRPYLERHGLGTTKYLGV